MLEQPYVLGAPENVARRASAPEITALVPFDTVNGLGVQLPPSLSDAPPSLFETYMQCLRTRYFRRLQIQAIDDQALLYRHAAELLESRTQFEHARQELIRASQTTAHTLSNDWSSGQAPSATQTPR